MLKDLTVGVPVAERDFDLIFPKDARKFSRAEWTPLKVAIRAAALLVDKEGARVLDVGSGAGKLCIVGALTTAGEFLGVEQDTALYVLAKDLIKSLRIPRVKYRQDDALALDWSAFDALYFFNPFANVAANEGDFMETIRRVEGKLAALRIGTRVVTYHGFGGQIPKSYVQEIAEVVGPGVLQLWVQG